MTHKERAAAALDLKIPDRVPTFELEYQLAEEKFGKPLVDGNIFNKDFHLLTKKEQETHIYNTALYFAEVFGALDYSIIPAYGPGGDASSETYRLFLKHLIDITEGKVMMAYHGDGTYAIPDGNQMMDFACRIADEPENVKGMALLMAQWAIDRNKKMQEAGIDCLLLCSDYCYNNGPFLSPAMFGEFIQPYLAMIIEEARKDGLYTIKHTDGNIMPILDQLVECRPHALHSLDPMAGVDIREVKALVGDKVALCGNVHCASMQTGTVEEMLASAEYCMTHGKPGGGYIFCTSNVPFKGMDYRRYDMVLDYWKKHRDYL